MENKNKTKKVFTAVMASLGVLILILALLQLSIWPVFQPNKVEASIYSPFGGKIENYNPKSDAECVEKSCGKINNKVQSIIRDVIETPAASFCTTISLPCSTFFGIGWLACFMACETAINGAVEAINVCTVEEITVGKPTPAKVGIFDIGSVDINLFDKIKIKLKLSSLLPNLSVVTPKIYNYKEYKTKGNWILGDSLDVLSVCKKAGKLISEICDILKGDKEEAGQEKVDALPSDSSDEDKQAARTEGEEEYSKDCPFLNLLNETGTNKETILEKIERAKEQ